MISTLFFRSHLRRLCSQRSVWWSLAAWCAAAITMWCAFSVTLHAQQRTIDSLQTALQHASQDSSGDSARVMLLLTLSGELDFSKPLAAMRYAEQALEIARRIKFERGTALSQNAFGVAARIQGLYAVAASYHFDALKKSESLADTQGIAQALHNIGRVYEVQRENDKALEYLTKALVLRSRLGNSSEIAETQHYIGNCYGNKRLFDSAMAYYTSALALRQRLNERRWMATLNNNIGWLLRLQTRFDSALVMFNTALKMFDSLNDVRGKALALDNIGVVYFQQKNYPLAVKTLSTALNFAEQSGDRREINDLYAALANAHEATNDFREANTYRRLRDALKDSLFNERSSKLVAELNSRYESEKREQEVLMLQKDAEKNALARNASAAVALLALGFVVYFAVNFRRSRSLNETLRRQQTELETRNSEIERANLRVLDVNHELASAYEQADALNTNLTDTLQALQVEKSNADALLLNILPASVAERLKAGEHSFAQRYSSATVFFADIANFTPLAASMLPEELVQILSEVFIVFDNVLERHGLEKIKTIGDCYMVASGLPQERSDHAQAAAQAALEMVRELQEFNTMFHTNLQLRVGMHSGAVVAGVIGRKKFAFDLWGDTVNIASRMESHGEPDKVHCSEEMYELLREDFHFEKRGEIAVKGRGSMMTYFLLAKKEG